MSMYGSLVATAPSKPQESKPLRTFKKKKKADSSPGDRATGGQDCCCLPL